MKKLRILSLVLAIALMVSCAGFTVMAEEPTEEPRPTIPTEPLFDPTGETAPQTDLAFGSVSVLQGSLTIDGNNPIGGTDRKLNTAQAAFAYERSTGTVIYSYNADSKLSPGSLAKIVTALIAIERCGLEDKVTCSSRNISRLPPGSQNQKLKDGEVLTVNDLLHCLILAGANDAAVALAEHIAGNQESFVAMMNQRVQQIGCNNTEFGNIHGLDNASQYTTARDMARIVQEATRNETFRDLFCAVEYTVPETNRTEERKFESQDYLVDSKNVQKFYDSRVTGGMQVSSSASGASIAYTASYHNMEIICVLLGCTREFYENGWQVKTYGNLEEALDLLNYVFNTYKPCRVLYNGQALKQFAVKDGECDVIAEPHIDIDTVLPADAHMDNLIMEYEDNGLTAPIAKGENIGSVQVWYRNTCLMEAELFAQEEVRRKSESGLDVQGGADRNTSDSKFTSIVGIISLAILIPVLSYLGINYLLRMRKRRMRRRRRSDRRRNF